MDSRHITNPYEDYSEGTFESVLNSSGDDINDEFREKLSAGTKLLMQRLDGHNSRWCHYTYDTTVYTGLPGIAYTYYHYGKYFEDQSHIARAADLIRKCLKGIIDKIRYVTFLTGNAGPIALGAVIYHSHFEKEEAIYWIPKLKSLFKNALKDSIPDELFYGKVGYLYSLLFVNKYISPAPIPADFIKEIIECILNRGRFYGKHSGVKCPLIYHWRDTVYFGGAHGMAGILYLLLQAKEYLTDDELKNDIEPSLQWLEQMQYPSGNFPEDPRSTTDKLVHWCHGAPSMTMLFTLAYEIFKKDQYLNTALQCGEVIWQRGLLKKGCGICHGVAGNAYSFLNLFQLTKDSKHLYRACKFAEWCLDYDAHQEKPADCPYSLFEGLAGTIYFLVDLQKPNDAKFPGYTV